MREESKTSNGGVYIIDNIQAFKSKVRKLSNELGVSHNQIIQNFVFEKFLDRLSMSSYKQNFIIKGGCLLSSIMGIDMRTTMDIDTNITGVAFTLDNIKEMIIQIISIKIDDNVFFEIVDIETIKELQAYDGYRFTLLCKFENISIRFHLDVSTGDIITPNAIEYSYKKILEDEYISLMSYNIETIIAEKLQSVLDKKIGNSRMKDFYDLYYFVYFKWNEINVDHLKEAVEKTFIHRNSYYDITNSNKILDIIQHDRLMNELWIAYSHKYIYAAEIKFNECISSIKQIINSIT